MVRADLPKLMTPEDLAKIFRVHPKTVTRWAKAGRIGSIKTPGGHRRFSPEDVKEALDALAGESG